MQGLVHPTIGRRLTFNAVASYRLTRSTKIGRPFGLDKKCDRIYQVEFKHGKIFTSGKIYEAD